MQPSSADIHQPARRRKPFPINGRARRLINRAAQQDQRDKTNDEKQNVQVRARRFYRAAARVLRASAQAPSQTAVLDDLVRRADTIGSTAARVLPALGSGAAADRRSHDLAETLRAQPLACSRRRPNPAAGWRPPQLGSTRGRDQKHGGSPAVPPSPKPAADCRSRDLTRTPKPRARSAARPLFQPLATNPPTRDGTISS